MPPSHFRERPSNWFEIKIGRALAVCVHPYAAWRVASVFGRVRIFFGYAAIAYLAALGALLF